MSEHELTSPEEVLHQLTGFWRTAIIRTAIDLRIADHIADGRDTLEAIAEAEAANPRSLKILLDAFCGMGFADRTGNRYTMRPDLVNLLRRRPGSVADVAEAWANDFLWDAWKRLTEAVRSGRPVESLEIDHPYWSTTFARATFGLVHNSARRVVPMLGIRQGAKTHILDIGCGSGGFGFALALADDTATVTGVDGEAVLAVAKSNALELDIEDRVRLDAKDIAKEESFGHEEFDIAVISNVLHLFSPEIARSIVQRASTALRPGGKAVISEYLPDEDRRRTPIPLMFAVFMALISEGNAYTFKEIAGWLEEAGLTQIQRQDMPGFFAVMIAQRGS